MFGLEMLIEEFMKQPKVALILDTINKQAPELIAEIKTKVREIDERLGAIEQSQDQIITAIAATQAILLRLEFEFGAFRAQVTRYILSHEMIPPSPPISEYRDVVSSVWPTVEERRAEHAAREQEHYAGDNAPFISHGAD